MESVLIAIVAAPGVLFLALALGWLLGWMPQEKLMARLTATVTTGLSLGAAWLGWRMFHLGLESIETTPVSWFRLEGYDFELALFVNHYSWPLVMLTALLVGIVGVFSVRYLHRDRGYLRFFLLLQLFATGALLVFTAGSFDLLLAGWELVGITSVLLIGFFDERREPVRNAGRVFAFYRVADLGLLVGIFLMHSYAHTARMQDLFANGASLLGGAEATCVALLLLMAAAGKSAQIPFSGWLPRAMEGPTPSSAIFYGAISVHLGAYLLLRARPLLDASPVAAAMVVAVGATTALLATLVHRASTDAKTSLAYAGMAQVGIVFVEIGFGFPMLALAHMIGHAVVRTLQFLRAPSMLHDYHRVHAAAGGHLGRTGVHYEWLLPARARDWLYRAAIERGYYDALIERVVTSPVLRLARWCEGFEPGIDGQPPKSEVVVTVDRSWVERSEA
jgi:NADH:ubiquinone oxidoreductase subunit 5 (subunit L)/multisubunit Na+/H+ antiporter MnhA subunit